MSKRVLRRVEVVLITGKQLIVVFKENPKQAGEGVILLMDEQRDFDRTTEVLSWKEFPLMMAIADIRSGQV